MKNQNEINATQLGMIAVMVEEYCTTTETNTSKGVELVLLELELSKAKIKLLEHKLEEYQKNQ